MHLHYCLLEIACEINLEIACEIKLIHLKFAVRYPQSSFLAFINNNQTKNKGLFLFNGVVPPLISLVQELMAAHNTFLLDYDSLCINLFGK